MVLKTQFYTVEQFFEFIHQPENINDDFELIGGEIVKVVSHGYASKVVMRIGRYVDMFVDDHDLGAITGPDGGYMVMGNPYIPDIGFISKQKQPKPEYIHGYNVMAPELAVEVLSPTDRESDLLMKVADYLAAGTTVWVFKPIEKMILVFVPGQVTQRLTIEDTLDGGTVLPDFSVPVKNLFPDE